MKNLFLITMTLISFFQLNAQNAQLAFHYFAAPDVSSAAYTSREVVISKPVVAPFYKDQMELSKFRQFGLYENLIEKIQEDDLKLHSFKLARESIRFDPVVLQSYGNSIDPEAQDLVLKAKNGDRYILYDIQVRCNTGEVYKLSMIAIAEIN